MSSYGIDLDRIIIVCDAMNVFQKYKYSTPMNTTGGYF